MATMVQKFIREDAGADLVEYAVIVALIAFGCVIAMNGANTSLTTFFSAVGTRLGELVQ